MSRPKRDWRSSSRNQYTNFCLENPEIKITFTEFQNIINKWNNLFASHILETGDKLKIPHGIGPLTINKYKPKNGYKTTKTGIVLPNRSIDWKATKQEGKYIYHLNPSTDGMKYHWAWFPRFSYIKSAPIWKFEMARVHSRQLAKYLKNPKDNHKDFYKQWIIKNNERI